MRLTLISLVLFISLTSTLFAQKDKPLPNPPESSNRLFYIQLVNGNVITYDANFVRAGQLHAKDPVHPYWIRYSNSEGGRIKELNAIQRNLAYGVTCKPLANEANAFDMVVVGYKKRRFKITTDSKGNPIAVFPINGKQNQLTKVFVKEEGGGLIPTILYVDLFGKDLKTGADVFERFVP
ncbi:protein of unknown function [Pseudarcicella hirudinis]|uniref:DUF4833 domain-containing protein n=1 Tax=Pseudarcicella hirudinis TaxID=1079859 RepID=A0A1I5QTB3_9BACT|nr:DUF4833 domain-containing protein [Pseudarcicella hirudinis]SFP49499.1 protein of unknown function [Pseudarcicella hirudinis]